MATRNKRFGARNFAMPVLLIFGLLTAHLVLSDWTVLPRLISSTLASIQ